MDADGSNQTRLTDNAAYDFHPSWSPDGQKIAFYSDRDGDYDVYVMNADGSDVVKLTDNTVIDVVPSWSPDGQKIAFMSNRDGDAEVYVMNADGSNVVRLTNNTLPVYDDFPSWSPDGNKIGFTSTRDGNREIYVMDPDGSNQTRLTDNAADDSHPSWSPDGQKIAFHSNRDGDAEVYVMNADSSDETTSEGIVSETDGSGSVTGSHTYTTAGVYTVTLTITDKDGGAGLSVFQYVVVYDPNGGFVTGGGWIDSPEGAYTPDPLLTGKATFGFVSKYKKGETVPIGQTEFQFKVAGLNFHSSSYDWLIITGGDFARYKGSGTINGLGDYKFMLWAGDGDPDTFRIKIWLDDEETGEETVIYDNGMHQPIGGGQIVVHSQ